jgi:hypothetical protein
VAQRKDLDVLVRIAYRQQRTKANTFVNAG